MGSRTIGLGAHYFLMSLLHEPPVLLGRWSGCFNFALRFGLSGNAMDASVFAPVRSVQTSVDRQSASRTVIF